MYQGIQVCPKLLVISHFDVGHCALGRNDCFLRCVLTKGWWMSAVFSLQMQNENMLWGFFLFHKYLLEALSTSLRQYLSFWGFFFFFTSDEHCILSLAGYFGWWMWFSWLLSPKPPVAGSTLITSCAWAVQSDISLLGQVLIPALKKPNLLSCSVLFLLFLYRLYNVWTWPQKCLDLGASLCT